jgi:hypothetical protein
LNLGLMLGSAKASPVLAVGLDVYKDNGVAAHEWAKEVGISSRDDVWIMRTGRGGITVVYHQPSDLELRRNIEGNAIPVDLLVNGYQVAPPSDTSSLLDGGGLYRWRPGYSPRDIHVADLMDPPDALTLARIAGWLKLHHPQPVVETLLLAINDGRCDPPLPEHEVRHIAQSISRYRLTDPTTDPKSHFRTVPQITWNDPR